MINSMINSPISSSPPSSRWPFFISNIITVRCYQFLGSFWSLLFVVVSVVVPPVFLIFPHLLFLSLLYIRLLFRVIISYFVSRTIIMLVKRPSFRYILWITPVLVVIQLLLRFLLFLPIPTLTLFPTFLRFGIRITFINVTF